MALNCYQVFKTVYQQAKTDGLADAVATAAAQTAMQDCLAKQSSRPSTVAQTITVAEGSKADSGPVIRPQGK